MTNQRERIAICLEYPIAMQGGVSVLCHILARELASRYEIVLVSADTPESFARSEAAAFVAQHIPWQPLENSARRSRQLAGDLAAAGVRLAHFHSGGNFG